MTTQTTTPNPDLASARLRIESAYLNGDRPDADDLEEFPECPTCHGNHTALRFYPDGCPGADCVYGATVPGVVTPVRAGQGRDAREQVDAARGLGGALLGLLVIALATWGVA